MPERFLRYRSFLLAALLLAGLPVAPAGAADTKVELDDRVRRSGMVFQEMKNAPDHEIPADLLARSRCVAVVPNVIKAAWVLGGRYGKGVLSCRSSKGVWSPPVFVLMTGGSFGLQFGASSTDVVLFFMTLEGVQSVLNNKVKLSGDAGVAAGPLGREAEAATDGQFRAQIYSYARSRGLFAGVSLSGAYLGVNVEDTREYYGTSYATTSILFEGKVTSVPKSTWSFLGALPRAPKTVAKAPPSRSKSAKAPAPKSASKSRSTATTAKTPPKAAPAPSAAAPASVAGEAAGPASAGAGNEAWGEASGTAAAVAGGDAFGEASGTAAASGEASGTAAAAPPPVDAPPPVR